MVAKKTIRYKLNPTKNVGEKPQIIDRITANTEPATDITPLIPYIQGMYFSRLFNFRSSMAEGNGIPIKNPNGNIKQKQTIERNT
ncbi:MAG: hypothetical protein PHN44_09250, partial [Candidatus Marinimicrobia bacterium]|nr:hypothetical protein [Candidatus Neomarinimicrobiota bacterium]